MPDLIGGIILEYMMIIYISGIQSIPPELNEAAKMNGAGFWQILRHVTRPIVMPSITICTFLIVGAIALIQNKLTRSKEVQQ